MKPTSPKPHPIHCRNPSIPIVNHIPGLKNEEVDRGGVNFFIVKM